MRLFRLWMTNAFVVVLLAGCADSQEPEMEPVDVFAKPAVTAPEGLQLATVTQPSPQALDNLDVDPCEILTDDLVRSHLPSAAGAVITRRLSEYSAHPLCELSWRKSDVDAIEASAEVAMQTYMQRKSQEEDAQMPVLRTRDELTLTLFEPVFRDVQLARNSFDRAMAILQRGVTGTHEGKQVTFQSDVFDVRGVGDKASWAEQLRQLSVVHGGRIFYVTVNTGADNADELATAIAVAQDVQKRL